VIELGRRHGGCDFLHAHVKGRGMWDDPELAWLWYFEMGFATQSDPDMDAATVCEHLDSGAGDELFKRYRSEEDPSKSWEYIPGTRPSSLAS